MTPNLYQWIIVISLFFISLVLSILSFVFTSSCKCKDSQCKCDTTTCPCENNLLLQSGYISDTSAGEPNKASHGTIEFPIEFGSKPVVFCQPVHDTTPVQGVEDRLQLPLFSIIVDNVTTKQFNYGKETIMTTGTQTTASSLRFYWFAIGQQKND